MNDADKLLAIAEKDRRVAQATLDDEEWVAEDVHEYRHTPYLVLRRADLLEALAKLVTAAEEKVEDPFCHNGRIEVALEAVHTAVKAILL